MILVQDNMNEKGIMVSDIIEYNTRIEKDTRDKFEKLKDQNIIINSEFDFKIWKITNQYKTIFSNFEFDEILYQKEFKSRQLLTYEQFVNSVKSYYILRINNYVPETLNSFLSLLKKIVKNTKYFNLNYIYKRYDNINYGTRRITSITLIKDFLEFIQINNSNLYIETFLEDIEYLNEVSNNYVNSTSLNRRNLSDFQTLFKFDKLLNEFWNEASEEEKIYYYPIYLWWNITNILPLRPSEFLLTPYDCIKKNEKGDYTISIRRSNLKGNGRMKYRYKVTYDLEKDYRICTYPILKRIAEDIKDYKEKTKLYNRDLLISIECYLGKDKEDITRKDTSFMAKDLNDLLLKFYINILSKKKNIEIVDDNYLEEKIDDITNEPVLANNQIKLLRAGDTRHFAMINMILNDFNPILIKDFAGHTNINTSYHYFGNIAEVVKCISYSKYKELTQYNNDNIVYQDDKITSNKILISMDEENKFNTKVDYGICLSEKFFNGNLEHCKIVAAECDVCDFFKRTVKETTESRKLKLDKYEENIRKEGKLLAELLRNNDNNIKEIGESVLKIQVNATRYISKFNYGGYSNGE